MEISFKFKDHHLAISVVTVPAAVVEELLMTKETSWLMHPVKSNVMLKVGLKNSSVKN